MLKSVLATGMFVIGMHSAAFAACTPEDAMSKSSDISEVLSDKMATKADDASKIMSDMGSVMGTGAVTADTCTKLDVLMARAKKL